MELFYATKFIRNPCVSKCFIQLQTPTSMASSVVEVLHEFAQIMISAAVGKSNVSS